MVQERKPWVGGNWKCNGTTSSITALCSEFKKQSFDPKAVDVVIFPTALHASLARDKLPSSFHVGLQNCSATANGAFTGEVSVDMIQDFGLKWALAGHSERRQYYGETDAVVASKVERLQGTKDVHTVLCVGENLQQRESGETNDIVRKQLEAVYEKITDWERLVIAYEPVWAIGTGKVASPEQAQEVHEYLREQIKSKAGEAVAQTLRLVYGGSVNEENCTQLMLQPDVDGFLVGGASLKKGFLEIISAATKQNA